MLLRDPRVDITLGDELGCTPLWFASCLGRCEVIEWLIASGRDLGDLNKKVEFLGDNDYSAFEIARSQGKTEAASLVGRLMANPTQTRYEVRVKLGWWMSWLQTYPWEKKLVSQSKIS